MVGTCAPYRATKTFPISRPKAANGVTPINRATEDTDPWRLGSIPAEHVADTMIAAIQAKPYAEVKAAMKLYAERVTLTDHEKAKVREALDVRREDERQANLLAAG